MQRQCPQERGICVEFCVWKVRSALEDLFPLDFGIPKLEQGHLAFLEKGNPPKRVEGEEFLRAGCLLNSEGRAGEREGSRTQSSLLPLGKGLSSSCLG